MVIFQVLLRSLSDMIERNRAEFVILLLQKKIKLFEPESWSKNLFNNVC